MADDQLVNVRDALKARFRWGKAPDALAWRIAALVDDPAEVWIDGAIQVGQIRQGALQAVAGTIVVITGSTITTIEFENVAEIGEPWGGKIETRTRRLRDVRSIETPSEPYLDTDVVDEDKPSDMPLFPPGWATITFDDGETLALPLSNLDEQKRGRLFGDALRRITRAM